MAIRRKLLRKLEQHGATDNDKAYKNELPWESQTEQKAE